MPPPGVMMGGPPMPMMLPPGMNPPPGMGMPPGMQHGPPPPGMGMHPPHMMMGGPPPPHGPRPPFVAVLPDYLPGAASLHEQLDRRILVVLRDGRNLVGVLRSFDQYSNMVLEDTVERHIVQGADSSSGCLSTAGCWILRDCLA